MASRWKKTFPEKPTFPRETRNREADDDDHLRVVTRENQKRAQGGASNRIEEDTDTQALAFWPSRKWCDRRPVSLVCVNNNDARDWEERLAPLIDYLRDYRGTRVCFRFW
jgi:hypothetical protein